MGHFAQIARGVLTAIEGEAAASPAFEICGLILGEGARIIEYRPCRNVAAHPATRFEIDPAALIAAYRAERAGGPRILGCYHSHPSGDPSPSRRDAADAGNEGWIWLIAGAGGVRAWRVVRGGTCHDRFDPVDLVPIG